MARLPLVHENDPSTPPEAKAALEKVRQQRGMLVNLYRAMANHPKALETFSDFATVTYRKGSLTPKEAELAYTTATVVNNCHY